MNRLKQLKHIGPGIAIAATGVGAGDMVAAAVSGSRYGYAVIWAALLGALLKGTLNEGLARWQLATGSSILEGWVAHLGSWVKYYFLIYLVAWSFIVGGAQISACGLAAHTIFPSLSIPAWGIIHAMVGLAFVLLGHYTHFETLMKVLIGLMFVALVGCALWVSPPKETLFTIIQQSALPSGSASYILGVIGGVGGSLTLLGYGYWMKEKQWKQAESLPLVRVDLGIAYGLTGIFGCALMVLSAKYLHANQITVNGTKGLVQMAQVLAMELGPWGYWTFVLGFWAAVTTSLIGVWQSVPYLFCDFIAIWKELPPEKRAQMVKTTSPWYRSYLCYLALAPICLLFFEKPILVILLYSVVGALFMPFLAGTLLYMNTRTQWVGQLKSSFWVNGLLFACLILFAYLSLHGVLGVIQKFQSLF